jgi:hypothetical protein
MCWPCSARDAVFQNCLAVGGVKVSVHVFQELAIEQRELKQPRKLAALREGDVHLQDSRNRIKDRQASRNRHESAWVGDQHVLVGTRDREEVLHSSDRNATRQECSRADDVAATNHIQTRDSGHWNRDWARWDGLDRRWREWLDRGCRERLDGGCWERLNWGRWERLRTLRKGARRWDRLRIRRNGRGCWDQHTLAEGN